MATERKDGKSGTGTQCNERPKTHGNSLRHRHDDPSHCKDCNKTQWRLQDPLADARDDRSATYDESEGALQHIEDGRQHVWVQDNVQLDQWSVFVCFLVFVLQDLQHVGHHRGVIFRHVLMTVIIIYAKCIEK